LPFIDTLPVKSHVPTAYYSLFSKLLLFPSPVGSILLTADFEFPSKLPHFIPPDKALARLEATAPGSCSIQARLTYLADT
jgi:hypothetical protein